MLWKQHGILVTDLHLHRLGLTPQQNPSKANIKSTNEQYVGLSKLSANNVEPAGDNNTQAVSQEFEHSYSLAQSDMR
jgi:hypothetical protein